MNAQKVFDGYRKKAGLPPLVLSKGQIALVEDTNLPFLVMSQEERRKAWDGHEVSPMPTFLAPPKDEDDSTRRFRRYMELEGQRKKEASLTALKERVAEKKAANPKLPKQQMGSGLRLIVVPGAKRAPGTKAAARFSGMVEYLKVHPGATVAEVLTNTGYRQDDYKWDLAKGNVKAEPVGSSSEPPKVAPAKTKPEVTSTKKVEVKKPPAKPVKKGKHK